MPEPLNRRADDLPAGTIELILYQLSEIKALLQKSEARHDRTEDRLGNLERWRERQEGNDEAVAASGHTLNSRWLPLFLTLLTLAATVALFVIQQGG